MEISKEGKKYLNKCNRTELIRAISDYKVGLLLSDGQMAYDLAVPVAYFIASYANSKEHAVIELNEFVHHLVYVLDKLLREEVGNIKFVEQIYEDDSYIRNSL